jgi:phosphoribosyl-ATP pyrophosphohydrolase
MSDIIQAIEAIIQERRGGDASQSYIASLFAKGRGKIAQKVGEEATECVISALTETPQDLTNEAADLIFHLLLLLNERGVCFADVLAELERREGISGIAEKNARGGVTNAN